MTRPAHILHTRGYSLIELLLTIAIMVSLFVAIIGMFRAAIDLIALNKSRGAALTLASERIEYLRSLSYDAVGTAGGIPAGTVPQLESILLNGQTFWRRTFIQYVDDPADGLDTLDSTGITADYKRAKVEVSWNTGNGSSSVSLVTNIVPRGVESLTGGGTLRVSVIDAFASPVEGAEVRVVNTTLSPSIDLIAYTNAAGQVIFPGAPAGSDYQINATRLGFSTDGTYGVTAENPNPSPAHISVADGLSSSITLAIDRLAHKTVRTRVPLLDGAYDDDFVDASGLAEQGNVTVLGGSLSLAETGGIYESAGTARSVLIAPPQLYQWGFMSSTETLPAGTTVRYRAWYDTGSGLALVPDIDLPGNTLGFSGGIDLSALPAGTYSALALGAELTTTDTSATPEIHSWSLSYTEQYVPIGSVAFTMFGTKSIGTNGVGEPVLKYSESHTTSAGGEVVIANLEWDSYTIAITTPGYDVAESCPPQPRGITPAESAITELGLVSDAAHTLRVVVRDTSNALIDGATVRLLRGAYDETRTTRCGQAFFTPLTNASDYVLSVTRAGFSPYTLDPLNISGDVTVNTLLTP